MADLPSLLPLFPPPSSFLHPPKSRHERDEEEEEEEEREFRPFYVPAHTPCRTIPNKEPRVSRGGNGVPILQGASSAKCQKKVEMKILLNVTCTTFSQICTFPFSLLNFVPSSLTLSGGGGGPHLPFPPNQTPYFFGTSFPPFPYTYTNATQQQKQEEIEKRIADALLSSLTYFRV